MGIRGPTDYCVGMVAECAVLVQVGRSWTAVFVLGMCVSSESCLLSAVGRLKRCGNAGGT